MYKLIVWLQNCSLKDETFPGKLYIDEERIISGPVGPFNVLVQHWAMQSRLEWKALTCKSTPLSGNLAYQDTGVHIFGLYVLYCIMETDDCSFNKREVFMRRAIKDVCAQPNAREFRRNRHCCANSNVNQHIVQLQNYRFSLLYVKSPPPQFGALRYTYMSWHKRSTGGSTGPTAIITSLLNNQKSLSVCLNCHFLSYNCKSHEKIQFGKQRKKSAWRHQLF